jgi:glutathione peroxidase
MVGLSDHSITPFATPLPPARRRRVLQLAAATVAAACWPGLGRAQSPQRPGEACAPLLNRQFPRLQDERPVSLCAFSGQVLLIVNTASFCGFTEQYRALEALNQRFGARGFAVLGFPSNDFGRQEPGSNQEIAAFCEGTFGVRFPMFAKSRVAAAGAGERNPLFADLARLTGESPRWNFHKYLVSRDARQVQSFASQVDPASPAFVAAVSRWVDSR